MVWLHLSLSALCSSFAYENESLECRDGPKRMWKVHGSSTRSKRRRQESVSCLRNSKEPRKDQPGIHTNVTANRTASAPYIPQPTPRASMHQETSQNVRQVERVREIACARRTAASLHSQHSLESWKRSKRVPTTPSRILSHQEYFAYPTRTLVREGH